MQTVRKVAEIANTNQLIKELGVQRFSQVLECLSPAEIITAARQHDLQRFPGIGPKKAERIQAAIQTAGFVRPTCIEDERFKEFFYGMFDNFRLILSLTCENYEAALSSTDEYLGCDNNPTTVQTVVSKMLDTLQDRERQVLVLHFGLFGEEPRKLKEIGDLQNVSSSVIHQLQARAFKRLLYPTLVDHLRLAYAKMLGVEPEQVFRFD